MLAPFPGTRFRESIAGGLPEEQYSQQIPWILSNAIESNRSRPSPSNNGATQLSKQRPFILTSPSAELVRDEERSILRAIRDEFYPGAEIRMQMVRPRKGTRTAYAVR